MCVSTSSTAAVLTCRAFNKLGEVKEMRCFYSVPEPISDSVKAERKAEQKRDAAERNFQFTLSQKDALELHQLSNRASRLGKSRRVHGQA